MKKTLLTLVLPGLCAAYVTAQSPDPSLTGSAGGVQQAAGHILSWSLGEPMVSYRLQSATWLTEGMQQPGVLNVATGIAHHPDDLHLQVYPNPAGHILHIASDGVLCGTVSISDMLGRNVIHHENIPENMISIGLEHLQPGLYLLRVQCEMGRVYVQSFVKL